MLAIISINVIIWVSQKAERIKKDEKKHSILYSFWAFDESKERKHETKSNRRENKEEKPENKRKNSLETNKIFCKCASQV